MIYTRCGIQCTGDTIRRRDRQRHGTQTGRAHINGVCSWCIRECEGRPMTGGVLVKARRALTLTPIMSHTTPFGRYLLTGITRKKKKKAILVSGQPHNRMHTEIRPTVSSLVAVAFFSDFFFVYKFSNQF